MNAAPTTDPPAEKDGGSARDRREAKVRRRRTVRILVAVGIVVVLAVTGGGVAWYLSSEVSALTAQNAAAKDLLMASDGKVAEQTTRVTLSTQISVVDAMLADPFFTRLPSETADARHPLAAASDAVRTSMVDFARGEVDAARTSLATAESRARKVYEVTKGKGADAAVRSRLQAALDTLATADTAAEETLGGADLAALQKTALDLGSYRSAVTAATDAMITAQDAASCPAPDQVWDPDSGSVPASALAPIPWAPSSFVRKDVLEGFVALDAAYMEAFGVHLTINSSYRTYAEQEELYDPSSLIAFPPGCSTHGLGLAVDIGGGVETFGTEQYNWLKANAKTYGWIHPAFAEPDGRVPEPWHWQSVLARETS